jgi:RepB DNA-primase from phage plasmid
MVLHGSLDSLWDALTSLSQRGAGIFVTINETDFLGRKASDTVRVRALFADLDGAPLADAWNVPLTPGWVSRTSPARYHIYWKVEGIERSEFRDLQKRISALTGGDPRICDLPRVLRLPGFPHQKAELFLVEGQAIDGGTVISVSEVEAVLTAAA